MLLGPGSLDDLVGHVAVCGNKEICREVKAGETGWQSDPQPKEGAMHLRPNHHLLCLLLHWKIRL